MGLAEWTQTDTELWYRLVAAVNLAAEGKRQTQEVAKWHAEAKAASLKRMGRTR